MKYSNTGDIIDLLNQFEHRKISYTISRYLSDSISICVVVLGERWEIDIDNDGAMQIEVFESTGIDSGDKLISELFSRFSD